MVLFMYTYVSIKLRVHVCKVAQFLKDSVQLEGFHKDITFLHLSPSVTLVANRVDVHTIPNHLRDLHSVGGVC